MSQKLVLANTSNNRLFTKVEVLDAYLRVGAYSMWGPYLIIFPIEWALIGFFVINTFINKNIKILKNLSL